jgi:hypothetical protein
MNGAGISIVAGIALTSGIAWAQGAVDPAAQLGDCNSMERAEGPECPGQTSPPIAAAPQAASPGNNWIVSQTTSPVDYSPLITATTTSDDGAAEAAMKLSIRCRGRRTELVVAGPGISGRSENYAIFYRVNDGQQVQAATAQAAPGTGVAFGGDVIGLLQSLPVAGSLSVHLVPRAGSALDGSFSLRGWETVRARMTVACKWSHPVAKPNR